MAVPDPFEFWRLFWQNSPVRSIEPFVDALAEGAGLAARVFETPSEAPEFFLLNHVRLDLPTMALREPDHNVHPKHPPCTLPTLIFPQGTVWPRHCWTRAYGRWRSPIGLPPHQICGFLPLTAISVI